jgi:hypothetical protein
MGASYAIGQKSTQLFDEGLEAGARYINAGPDEVGKTCLLNFTNGMAN